MTAARSRLFAVLAAVALVLTLGAWAPAPPAAVLEGIVENVPAATKVQYQTRDNHGANMDTLKIVDAPGGGYLGVYHETLSERIHTTYVATSPDMFTWTRRAVISRRASMPTIRVLPDRSVLIAEEADNNSSASTSSTWLRVSHYPTVAALLAGKPSKRINLPHTLAHKVGAEGTPDIREVSPDLSRIALGFHYLDGDRKVDRQAWGVLTNFRGWRTWPLPAMDRAVGVADNIGDRDRIVLGGQHLYLVEGRLRAGDFGSWRVFLYDGRMARRMDIRTHAGSTAFANPTISRVRAPSGRPAVVVTAFLNQEGARGGESGQLVYYREIGTRLSGKGVAA